MAACGQLTEFLSWPWTIAFMITYIVLTAALCWRLPETHPPDKPSFSEVREILWDYGRVLSNRTFLYCALITGLAVAALYVYATDAALIATTSLGMSAGAYYSLIPCLGAIVSLRLIRRLGDRMSFTMTTLMGFSLIAVAAIPMLLLFMAGMVSAWTTFGLTLVLIGGTMPLNVNYVTIAENSTLYRGVVACLISSIFMFVSMLAVQASSLLEPLIGDKHGHPSGSPGASCDHFWSHVSGQKPGTIRTS